MTAIIHGKFGHAISQNIRHKEIKDYQVDSVTKALEEVVMRLTKLGDQLE